MFPNDFASLPNLHVNVHLPQHACNFGTLVNTAVAVKEMVHHVHKGRVPRLNRKAIEFDLMRRENTVETIQHLVDGWEDRRFSMTSSFKTLAQDISLRSILSEWHATELSLPVEVEEDDGNGNNCHSIQISFAYILYKNQILDTTKCHDHHFVDILLRVPWTDQELAREGWSKKLSATHPLFQSLAMSYATHLKTEAAILDKRLKFYKYISYTVLNDDDDEPTRVQLHVGDVVEICEQSEGIAYVKIKTIIQHRANIGQLYAFLLVNWFEATASREPVLDCPLYNIQ